MLAPPEWLRFRGCLAGLAAGDAVGTTVEFMTRGGFEPLRDMVGGGPFNLRPGQWTDDTSMALCLAESLIEKGGFDARDQMERYCRWMETGYLSSTGSCFDIGSTVAAALQRYRKTGEPYSGSTHPRSAGNGTIMRLAPVPMKYFPDMDLAESMAGESSRTTHGAQECIDACRLLARMTVRALSGRSKEEILMADRDSVSGGGKYLTRSSTCLSPRIHPVKQTSGLRLRRPVKWKKI
ncbi:ADP-ribosylation/Crystallin J1 [Desulfonatronospira thiodismutans ASO3-1]|uniref:ADP-ribosylation/Crystallin J1 n=1 Tax=Desulfonatronospira thiodismutans ASO3-1 TaxID=555779 RepID=D6SN16_9BACT|nr:ADP-ribosylglycohydrolase family protein [Desulfonatronospira thiodismutans]EFI36077.1 ADP-ribosylation/Crystallin J1 [Desulfonatronospira thiodismutans ASO3-1]